MSALLDTIGFGHRSRDRHVQHLDSVYGDLHITPPLGYPSRHADLYLKDSGFDRHDQSDERIVELEYLSSATQFATDSTEQNHPRAVRHGYKTQHLMPQKHMEKARQRSKSQPGISYERRACTVQSQTTSCSNRKRTSCEEHQPTIGKNEICTKESLQKISVSDSRSLRRDSSSRPAILGSSTSTAVRGGIRPGQRQAVKGHERSYSDSYEHKGFQTSYTDQPASPKRAGSPAAAMLSPVSEVFVVKELCGLGNNAKATRDSNQLALRSLPAHNCVLSSMSSMCKASDTLPMQSQPHQPPMLPSKHNKHSTDLLANSSTLPLFSQKSSHLIKTDQASGTAVSQLEDGMLDKPLPPIPASSPRSAFSECTTLLPTLNRAGPALESTSVMRTSSRSDHRHQSYSQQHKDHSQFCNGSASLNHKASALAEPRQQIQPDDAQRYDFQHEPSSVAPELIHSPASNSTTSSVPTPDISPDQYQGRTVHVSSDADLATSRRPFEQHWSRLQAHETHSQALVQAKFTGHVGGNIYNEIRDDLAFVARDLNDMNIAARNDRGKKNNKLRTRARSTSRYETRTDHRRGGSDSQRKYNSRELDKSELKGAWGNVAFVPASDSPELGGLEVQHAGSRGTDEMMGFRKPNVEIVPEYDDLWG